MKVRGGEPHNWQNVGYGVDIDTDLNPLTGDQDGFDWIANPKEIDIGLKHPEVFCHYRVRILGDIGSLTSIIRNLRNITNDRQMEDAFNVSCGFDRFIKILK